MRLVDPSYRTIYSELAERCVDAAFSHDFPLGGRFVPVTVKNRRYWYHDIPDGHGSQVRRYVGPADDAAISERVEHFNRLKDDARGRRRLVATLVREAYLPRPDRMAGDIVGVLAEAGVFRLRGVLVGSLAFLAYPALLGARLPQATMTTSDADFAQFHCISAAVGDAIPSVLELLREVDPSFRDIPHTHDPRHATRFVCDAGYRVDFLVPNTGRADWEGRPATMPALGGASAEPLRFLDFLIHEPVRAVLLHGAGVPVLVPAPARFAVHKLIVAERRRADQDGMAKAFKDLRQAEALVAALVAMRFSSELGDAWMEAWERGPAWRAALQGALSRVDDPRTVRTALAGAVTAADGRPADFGL